ncbi:hypothetical protein J7E63_11420 [Bacillus sp. ISL-75]|uniref:hypothetical protein n=1 Tax=Bacillus sp. ISL-75 TaxID=2819137 RepID=UPI001BE6E9F8|nr:hypothetical protein [Bacillus sp. ISL-75]MBT2727542.1 hypothetical protein [Bacillus sp. ISL-75]
MGDFRLIPYNVDAVEKTEDQIPDGLKVIEAPYLWDKGYYRFYRALSILKVSLLVQILKFRQRLSQSFRQCVPCPLLSYNWRGPKGERVLSLACL